ncbi:MAG: hypothetical protein Tp156SUR1554471_35 [Prokaryotic dsDNA virus sp.]|nr:MAG: hypothetical protein Tp156SUR1554471_35 [Prokaryotic dsDNA virus sp.]|tara:strand:- start:9039 stop:10028 length:990 start_codon:yes stop_codon:yes gene_type:complete
MPVLDRAELQLYIYDGTSGGYSASDLKYTLSKSRISTQDNILFEISELVRDYIDLTFNNDYLSKTKWVTAITRLYDADGTEFATGSPVTNNYLALDGYGYFEDGINPQLSDNLLMTNTRIYLPENTAGKLPILAEGVGKVIIDSATTQVTDNGNSNQKIQYLTIPANSSTIQVYDTDDATLLATVTVDNVCEPKFTPYKITFVNKHGAYQDVYMFKKSIERMNVKDEVYKANIIDASTLTYATYKGQQERYNVSATKSLEMNTGFVDENFNQAIEELLLSENVWIRWEGKTLPVLVKTKDMTYKTSLNDKLINHTLQFEFAFSKINNIK